MLSEPSTFYDGGFGAENNFVIVLLDFKCCQHMKCEILKDLWQTNVRLAGLTKVGEICGKSCQRFG